MTSVERAAELFTSMKAAGPTLQVRDLAEISEDHGLDGGALFDALSFLEANGMIEVRTIVIVGGKG